VGARGNPIILVNNPGARNPSWAELFQFLLEDQTDKQTYSYSSFVCADFAEMLHNNAEKAGIRAGFVYVNLEGGETHCLNVFETTDRGLIFIDDTGRSELEGLQVPGLLHYMGPLGTPQTYGGTGGAWDKVAYVSEGEPLGLVSLGASGKYGTDYLGYKQWQEDKALFDSRLVAYNQDAEAYTQALGGRWILAGSEYSKFKDWYDRLQQQSSELDKLAYPLGAFWESLGVVKDFKIYW
jgi:hypothetical protein